MLAASSFVMDSWIQFTLLPPIYMYLVPCRRSWGLCTCGLGSPSATHWGIFTVACFFPSWLLSNGETVSLSPFTAVVSMLSYNFCVKAELCSRCSCRFRKMTTRWSCFRRLVTSIRSLELFCNYPQVSAITSLCLSNLCGWHWDHQILVMLSFERTVPLPLVPASHQWYC